MVWIVLCFIKRMRTMKWIWSASYEFWGSGAATCVGSSFRKDWREKQGQAEWWAGQDRETQLRHEERRRDNRLVQPPSGNIAQQSELRMHNDKGQATAALKISVTQLKAAEWGKQFCTWHFLLDWLFCVVRKLEAFFTTIRPVWINQEIWSATREPG